MAYFPNGTAIMCFWEMNCQNCLNADDDGFCAIYDAHVICTTTHEDDCPLHIIIPKNSATCPLRRVAP